VSVAASRPLRGEVWDVHLARAGRHPVVVLTVNRLLRHLSSATVVLVTGTPGPRSTHVPLGVDAGLTRYDESYAVATELHNVPISALTGRRGRLSRAEMRALESAVRSVHGLDDDL